MTIADTSALLAYFNAAEPAHEAVARAVAAERDPLVVSPYVIAELDYLIATRIGTEAELAVLTELASGAYDLPGFDAASIRAAHDVISRYADQSIGLADASLVILADRYATRRVLTLDHRHFDLVRPIAGKTFRLAP